MTWRDEIAKAAAAESEREAALAEDAISHAWRLVGAGCRALALGPPGSLRGRGIVTLHEWPRNRLRLRARCYCGEQRK